MIGRRPDRVVLVVVLLGTLITFAAYVGGSPTNVCVGAQRLGLKTAMLTAVGAGDPARSAIAAQEVEHAL